MAKRKNKLGHDKAFWLTLLLALTGLGALVALFLRGTDVILLNPKGLIASEQHRLMIRSILLMLEIAIPTLFILYYFAWKYRETNEKATYDPSVTHSKFFLAGLWTFPIITLFLLASIMLPATQKLEPQRLIAAEESTLSIQVVALRWKWLFIYPEQNIATVNYVQIPMGMPVQFELTADETPMSSFWIPHLGGMLYAMTEHVNRLNLVSDTIGDYEGSAAEINGAGFAGMRFMTRVSTQADFDTWAQQTAASSRMLTTSEYAELLKPSKNNPAAFYSSPDPEIFATILSKYAGESHQHYTEHEGGH